MTTKKKAAKKEVAFAAGAAAPTVGAPLAAASDPGVTLAVLQATDNAEHAAEECAGRARQIRIGSLDLDEKADALAEEIRASNLAQDCSQIEIDLNAAKIKVEVLGDDDIATLTNLSQKLDRQIVVSQLLNTGLSAVTNVLQSVVKVRDIMSSSSLQS